MCLLYRWRLCGARKIYLLLLFLYTHTRARAYAQRYSPTCLLAHASFRPSLRAHSDYPKDGLRPSGARVGGEAEDARLTRAS